MHLGECVACRAELEELQSLKRMLGGLPQQAVPRSFAIGPRRMRPEALSGSFGGFLRALTSVAAALLVVTVGLSLVIRGLPRQGGLAAAPVTVSSPSAGVGAAAPSSAPPQSAAAQAAARPAASASPRAAAPAAAGAKPAVSAAAPAAGAAAPQSPNVTSARSTGGIAAEAPAGTVSVVSAAPAPTTVSVTTRPAARPAPIDVPQLTGELILLLAGLGVVVYSIRWWRSP